VSALGHGRLQCTEAGEGEANEIRVNECVCVRPCARQVLIHDDTPFGVGLDFINWALEYEPVFEVWTRSLIQKREGLGFANRIDLGFA